jgi:KaiC/GvpD/RAD55 family RecA-like ATPase
MEVPLEIFDDVDPGTNLLVTGPPMTGKYTLLLELLTRSSDAIVVITTKNGGEKIRTDLGALRDIDPTHVGVVDCVSQQRDVDNVTETETSKFVSSPKNLTQIGVEFTDLFERFHEREHRTRVGLHSASQLVMYANLRQVYQFLQVLTGKIQSAGWIGGVVLDSTAHDEQTIYTLQELFDGVVETRESSEGRREMRVRGLAAEATPWQPF